MCRNLERRDLAIEEVPEFRWRDVVTVLGIQRHGDFFAKALVRHSEHGCFVHGRMLVDGMLHLGAVHVFACPQNHVLGTIFDVEEALFIHTSDVARAQPAIHDGFRGGFRLVPVATNEHRTEHPNLTGLAYGKCRAVVVANLHQHRWRTTSRAGRVRHVVVTTVAGAERIGLGHAVTKLRPALLEAVGHLVHQRCRCRRTATTHRAQRRRVELCKVGMVDEVPALGGHSDEVGDLLALDDLQCLTGIPLVHDHEFQSGDETAHQHRNATGHMEQRHDENERRREWIRLGLLRCPHTLDCLSRGKRHQRTDHRAMR